MSDTPHSRPAEKYILFPSVIFLHVIRAELLFSFKPVVHGAEKTEVLR